MNEIKLKIKAAEARKSVIEMVMIAKDGHIPSALSMVEIITVLYNEILNIDPKNPKKPNRDRFILSKGHGCSSLYAVMADLGFFPKTELNKFASHAGILGGHPDFKRIPGIEVSTGSLAQGFSMAVGFAISAKLKKENYKVYCIVGDGECNEGSIWEAAQVAAHYKLDNLFLIVDHNKHQSSGKVIDVINPISLRSKFEAFGWNAKEIDGHNISKLIQVFKSKSLKGVPTAIIANTIKGKGISFMEDQTKWHTMIPNDTEYAAAMKELNDQLLKLRKRKQKKAGVNK